MWYVVQHTTYYEQGTTKDDNTISRSYNLRSDLAGLGERWRDVSRTIT